MEWEKISGAFYDWEKTRKPEKSYRHNYHQALVLKMFMSIPDNKGGSIIGCTFSQAFDRIKELDKITCGVPKIIYLVGWQYDGHDDRYPSWDQVNERLKRQEDKTGLESLRWLMEAAKAYNTTVSLHINMTDAYPISPLWKTYVDNDLISKGFFGQLKKTGKWNGRMAYQINYTHEWEKGYAQKRIDQIVQLLNMNEIGTVHIDAFFCRRSMGHRISVEQEQEYRRKIIRYWREKGVDVTSEFLYAEAGTVDLIGLIPMVWWINQRETDYLERPAGLITGGKPNRKYKKYKKNLHRMFGKNIHGEDLWMKPGTQEEDPQWHSRFVENFCVDSLPFFYLNQLERIGIQGKGKNKKALYSKNMVSYATKHFISDGHWVLKDGKDVLVPNIHDSSKHLYGYSLTGYVDKCWHLPKDWGQETYVEIERIFPEGEGEKQIRPVEKGSISLTLKSGEMVRIKPKSKE